MICTEIPITHMDIVDYTNIGNSLILVICCPFKTILAGLDIDIECQRRRLINEREALKLLRGSSTSACLARTGGQF